MPNTRSDEQPLVVSRHKTARLIDCSLRHVDYLTERGVLEKGLAWSAQGQYRSILRLGRKAK